MTDLATTEAPSTALEPQEVSDPSGGGAPPAEKAPEKPESVRDAVAASMKEEKPADDPKPDADKGEKATEKGAEKPEDGQEVKKPVEEKKAPERGTDGKFAAKEKPAAEAPPTDTPKADEKPNGHIEAPSKFLPDAKETWRNTPRAVQRDVQNMAREHEAEITRYREAAERYEPIRQFDEMVRQNGRAGVHETLAEVAQLEELMGKNPLAAINQILLRAGPRKPDGSPVSLFEVAQTVVQMGQEKYQQAVRHQPQQAPQNDNPRIQQLEQQLAQMQQQQLAASIIEPFKRDHPRYAELQDDIAFFLKSGKIPNSLSPAERLEAAYDMAVRINPASHAEEAPKTQAGPDPDSRVDEPPAAKSIKSAPGSVSDDMEPERGGSIRELLADELRRQKRA